MNKDRRKRLEKIAEKFQTLQEEIEQICSEEQDAYDNLPENLQEGEKGQKMQDNVDALEDIKSNVEDQIDLIQTLLEE